MLKAGGEMSVARGCSRLGRIEKISSRQLGSLTRPNRRVRTRMPGGVGVQSPKPDLKQSPLYFSTQFFHGL